MDLQLTQSSNQWPTPVETLAIDGTVDKATTNNTPAFLKWNKPQVRLPERTGTTVQRLAVTIAYQSPSSSTQYAAGWPRVSVLLPGGGSCDYKLPQYTTSGVVQDTFVRAFASDPSTQSLFFLILCLVAFALQLIVSPFRVDVVNMLQSVLLAFLVLYSAFGVPSSALRTSSVSQEHMPSSLHSALETLQGVLIGLPLLVGVFAVIRSGAARCGLAKRWRVFMQANRLSGDDPEQDEEPTLESTSAPDSINNNGASVSQVSLHTLNQIPESSN
jgi:hypothetical protein